MRKVRLFLLLVCTLIVPVFHAAVDDRSVRAQTLPAEQMRVLLPLVITAPATPGTSTGAVAAGASIPLSLEHNGVERTLILSLPDAYAPGVRLPLVINMHGAGGTGAQQQSYTGFDTVAHASDMLVVYPDGINQTWAALGLDQGNIDDVGFISALIDFIDAQYGVDLQRVYAFGFSQGGFMSFRLACELSDRIAAVGSVAGLMYIGVYNDCAPTRPVPIMLIHGTRDPVVPYEGTELFPGALPVLDQWYTRNSCPRPPQFEQIPNTETVFDRSLATRIFTDTCAAGSEVLFHRIANGGHTWPGAAPFPLVGPTNQDLSANEAFTAFFLRHQLPAPTSSAADEP